MYDHNQTNVPPSFTALYVVRGRLTATRATIEERYALCEALAESVSAFNSEAAFREALSPSDVLRRCWTGLLAIPETVSSAEAGWITGRSAELLDWPIPDFTGVLPA